MARAAVIVTALRTPVGRAPAGALRHTRPDELAALVIREVVSRTPELNPALVDDVIFGCAMPEAEQGLNVARIASLRAGLPVSASAVTVNRFCASSLEAIAIGANRIAAGEADIVIAGGTESMSQIPMGGNKISPNPELARTYPDVYLTTGLVAENHARDLSIARDAQDAFALRSHQRALAAADEGRFADELIPVPLDEGRTLSADEGPRRDTSIDALAKLRPAFLQGGSVTAGNSSQTSDGAAAVVLMSEERAAAMGLTRLARFVGYATAGVAPERFGLGPVPAVRKLLSRLQIELQDIDLVEFNEAFAAQVLACLAELPIEPDRLNVNGGAIALGHPLGCTGAKLTTTLVHEMQRRGTRLGLVTMCVGGGMGAAALFER
jgi:acetyl-CoA acyltransferase